MVSDTGWKLGQTLRIQFGAYGACRLRVVALFASPGPLSGYLVSNSTLAADSGVRTDNVDLVRAPGSARAPIRAALAGYPGAHEARPAPADGGGRVGDHLGDRRAARHDSRAWPRRGARCRADPVPAGDGSSRSPPSSALPDKPTRPAWGSARLRGARPRISACGGCGTKGRGDGAASIAWLSRRARQSCACFRPLPARLPGRARGRSRSCAGRRGAGARA